MKTSEGKIKLRNNSKNTRKMSRLGLGYKNTKQPSKCRNGALGVIL